METPKFVNMKLAYILLSAFFISSCATSIEPITRNGGASTAIFSFTEYLDKGFQFSIYPPTGNYSVLGIINTTIEPKIISVSNENKGQNGLLMVGNGKDANFAVFELKDVIVGGVIKRYGVELNLSSDTLLNEMYKEAISLGANGISDFTLTYETLNTGGLDYRVLKGRGVAIKTE